MKNMINWLKEEESGQGMVEYALILALIALAVVAGVSAVGKSIDQFYRDVNGKIPNVG